MALSREDITAIAAEVISQLKAAGVVFVPPRDTVPTAKAPGEIALEMARNGLIEESKAYLRSLSSKGSRRKAA